jgi:hypothetical protein
MIMKTSAAFAVSSSTTLLVSAAALLLLSVAIDAQCIADEKIDAEFRTLLGVDAIPKADSCCQADVCGIPCPAEISDPKIGTFFFHTTSVFLGRSCPNPPHRSPRRELELLATLCRLFVGDCRARLPSLLSRPLT